jgi:hypothetical protein
VDLEAQLSHLDRLLLSPVNTSFPDELPDEEKAAVNAYVVLAHAVIEEYLEDVFERHFRRLVSWLDSPLVPLESARLALAMGEWLPEKRRESYKSRRLLGDAKLAKKVFHGEVGGNHGIKTPNLQKLAGLVGLEWPDFEATLSIELADLQSFGSKRGEASHLSPYTDQAVSITRTTYPDDVREWVDSARAACNAVATYLDDLVSTQQPQTLIVDWDGN